MNEIWRPVPGWEDLYEASSHGRVRSLDRVIRRSIDSKSHTRRGRILKPMWSLGRRAGYRYGAVLLCAFSEGVPHARFSSRLSDGSSFRWRQTIPSGRAPTNTDKTSGPSLHCSRRGLGTQ